MATAPNTPQAPRMDELAPREDPLNPLRLDSLRAASYTQLLTTGDSVLASKGGIENLKVYQELLRDDQVSSTWGQRSLALTACETVVEPGAEDATSKAAAEALQAELDALQWDDITGKMLYGRFFGWAVAECLWKPSETPGLAVSFAGIKVRDRARFRFDRMGGLYLWAQGTGWAKMPDRKFWTFSAGADHDDEPYGLGLAHALYWPVFFKRNDIKFWLIFLEKFGMPTAMAKLDAAQMQDPETKRNMLTMLRQIATDAGVLVPKGADGEAIVELLEAARSGAADYETLCSKMDAAISKVIVGQTMTTDDGSSRAQAEVHAGVAQKIVEADSDLLCGSFNAGPVKWWTEWNFPGAVPPRVYRHTEPPEDLNQRADRDTKIKGLGYSPTEDYILKTYGEGWEKSEDPLQAVAAGMRPNPNDPNAPPADFAEDEALALAALKAARRGDQAAIVQAARNFAGQYRTVMGKRVAQLLEAAEFSEDPATFRRRLNELLAEEEPPQGTMDKLVQAISNSRLMAAIRYQRQK